MGQDIFDFGGTAYLAGGKAVVLMQDNSEIVGDKNIATTDVVAKKGPKEAIKFIPRGSGNNMPHEVLEKVYKNVTVSSNVDFNSRIVYGDGIMVVKKIRNESGKIEIRECLPSDEPEIFSFLEDNNLTRVFQEIGNDVSVFNDSFVEFILDNNRPPKLVMIRHKEMCCSRLSKMDEKSNKIEWHGYSAQWGEGQASEDLVVTPLLDRQAPIYDLKQKIGILPDEHGKNTDSGQRRFILSISLPTPGRYYYGKPYWWSIFESGWYDFACAIPQFKKALLKNQMVLKYEVLIQKGFYDKLFSSEGITDEDKKKERKRSFLKQMNDFLSGEDNAGKSFVSHFEYDKVKGFEVRDIIIRPIESFFKGGEYIEDSEEASNIICYSMGVHPSIVGASPGKGKSINGTEARELFIIKQALMKPIRDMMLMPLYIAKALNKWDLDIHFVIPNIMLTTLDKNTGSEKNIGNEKL